MKVQRGAEISRRGGVLSGIGECGSCVKGIFC